MDRGLKRSDIFKRVRRRLQMYQRLWRLQGLEQPEQRWPRITATGQLWRRWDTRYELSESVTDDSAVWRYMSREL